MFQSEYEVNNSLQMAAEFDTDVGGRRRQAASQSEKGGKTDLNVTHFLAL